MKISFAYRVEDCPRFRALKKSRKLYEQGDKTQLIPMLYYYIETGEPVPFWLGQEFRRAYGAAWRHEVKSWDDVFGPPLKKGKRPATERRNKMIAWQIIFRVQELHKAGKAIDKSLFDFVGKEFGIGGTTASDLYYKTLKGYADFFGQEYKESDVSWS
jgi:hypothetical protein